MLQSTIIVDPKSEIKGKQDFSVYIVKPTVLDKRESIRIKDVQDLLTWCAKSSFHGTQKHVVIEELQKASDAVPHALLKLLEEPPADTTITITIDRAESALATIRSRCAVKSMHELDSAAMEQLGVVRSHSGQSEAAISWQEFSSKTSIEQLEWLINFIKSKKDCYHLIATWQGDLVVALNDKQAASHPQAIRQLALLEEIGAALRQNVLPRLALNYLHIRLQQL